MDIIKEAKTKGLPLTPETVKRMVDQRNLAMKPPEFIKLLRNCGIVVIEGTNGEIKLINPKTNGRAKLAHKTREINRHFMSSVLSQLIRQQ